MGSEPRASQSWLGRAVNALRELNCLKGEYWGERSWFCGRKDACGRPLQGRMTWLQGSLKTNPREP